jgi:hypothetical protein
MMSDGQGSRRVWLFGALAVSLPVLLAGMLYMASVIYRTVPVYRAIKTSQRGWIGQVFKADPELGFTSVPDSRGSETAPYSPPLQMRFDGRGLRVPVRDDLVQRGTRPLLLFLGCSFTYGDLTPAEETFAYLTGKAMGGTALNAGVGSFGLSQMLLVGSRLIPEYKPDYVVIQYADWLIDRAVNPFSPTYFGKAPSPYFFERNGNLELQRPVFDSILFDLPIDEFQQSQRGAGDFLSFLARVGFPLFLHDDASMVGYQLRRLAGGIPVPTSDRRLVVESVYRRLVEVARQNGAIPVIVVLGRAEKRVPVPTDLFPKGVLVVDAHEEQLRRLAKQDRESYAKHYFHWRGEPPVIIDSHPNPEAHRVISEAIIKGIHSEHPR